MPRSACGSDGVRPRVLLLDLDGPILDVRARYYAAHQHASEGLADVGMIDPEPFWRAKRERMPITELLGVPAGHASVARYQARWREVIETDPLLSLDTLQPGAVDALQRLRPLPQRVLVTVRTAAAGARATLERLQLTSFFTHIEIVPHAVGSKAPAFRTWGTVQAPRATLVIGDTEIDIEAAHAVGFPAIAVSCGMRTAEFLSTLDPVAVVPDLGHAVDLILCEAL
jgi:phosphoglycolate phosphatase